MTKLSNIPTTAALRLTGTKSEIELVLAVLRGKDFFWKTNGKFYPQRGEESQYAYYLNDLQLPQLGAVTISQQGENTGREGAGLESASRPRVAGLSNTRYNQNKGTDEQNR
jgi:hypothetical protein